MAQMPSALADLVKKMTPLLSKAFSQAISEVTSTIQLSKLVLAISQHRLEDVLSLLSLSEANLGPLTEAFSASYMEFARSALGVTILVPQATTSAAFFFNGRNPRAEAWLRQESSRMIVEISNSQMEAVREVLERGWALGRNPTRTALDLIGNMNKATKVREGGIIGLNSQLSRYVTNARAELSSADPTQLMKYLDRTRRDKKYDVLVETKLREAKALAKEGNIPLSQVRIKPLNAETVDKLSARYSDRLLKYRGDLIGRTETLTSMNAARHEAYLQLEEAGVHERHITRIWRAAGNDGHTRETHLAMDGQVVLGLKDPFVSPNGARMMHPTDSSLGAGAEETIQCRCWEEVKVDYVAARLEVRKTKK